VSTGVHNIAFLLSPDRFHAFDLFFFGHKTACLHKWVRMGTGVVTAKGTRVEQDAVAKPLHSIVVLWSRQLWLCGVLQNK
jgi:hypothetical protein